MDIFTGWQNRCKSLGISLSELSRLVGVSRSTIELYKQRVPKPVADFLKINKALEEMEEMEKTD